MIISSATMPSLRRLHCYLALAALLSTFLPWFLSVRAELNDVVTESVNQWSYPGGKLLVLFLIAGFVISMLEKVYARGTGCAQVALFVANLLVGVGLSMVPAMRGNLAAPVWGFMVGFLIFILFHAVSIMLSPRGSNGVE